MESKAEAAKQAGKYVIIDWASKGNVVRFFLGKYTEKHGWINPAYAERQKELRKKELAEFAKTHKELQDQKAFEAALKDDFAYYDRKAEQYYGDDWDDAPWEHNAGSVYDCFIAGYRDVSFPFDDLVLEPYAGPNSPWCKDDMAARRLPCVVVVQKEAAEGDPSGGDFSYWAGADRPGVIKYYFGDEMRPDVVGVFSTAYPGFGLMEKCEDEKQDV